MTLREQIAAFRPYNEQEETERRLMLRYMDTFPDLLTRENEMAHFTASCWIVNPARTHTLMAFHNLYQSWAWLGGHADGEAELNRRAKDFMDEMKRRDQNGEIGKDGDK